MMMLLGKIKKESKSAHLYYFTLLPMQVGWTYNNLSTTGVHVIKVTMQCVPKKGCVEDSTKEIKKWQQEGGVIILLTDLNDVRDKEIMRLLQELGLEEAIMATNRNEAPPTHQCSCKPIDGVFMLGYMIS